MPPISFYAAMTYIAYVLLIISDVIPAYTAILEILKYTH